MMGLTDYSNEWNRDRISKAKFNNVLSLAKTRIASLMRENDNIIRLLKYIEANALDESKPVTNKIKKELFTQGTKNTRVFLTSFDGETVKEQRAEVHMSIMTINVEDHSFTKIPVLVIDIIVATGVDALDDGMTLRHDLLFQEISDAIEGYSVGAVGYLELLSAKESTLKNNTHSVWSAIYKVGEIKV